MRKFIGTLAAALAACAAAVPAQAQDINEGEVVVTGSRVRQVYIDPRTNRAIERDDDDETALPSVGLRRRADSALLPVVVAGDTREMDQRRQEILTMVRTALERARGTGIELAIGDFFVVPLTADNYRTLAFIPDGRPDSERVTFLGAAHFVDRRARPVSRADPRPHRAGRPRRRRPLRPRAGGGGARARPPGRVAPRGCHRGVPLYSPPARLPPGRLT
jgi:hypothetical protein